MTTYELSQEQLEELKGAYLCELYKNVSYYKLGNANELVDDEEVHEWYKDVYFTDDDFACSCQGLPPSPNYWDNIGIMTKAGI